MAGASFWIGGSYFSYSSERSGGCPALLFLISLRYTNNAVNTIRTTPAKAAITTPAIAPPDSDAESDGDNNGVEVAEALAAFSVVVAEVETGLDVAVTSADNLDAIAALLIASRDEAAMDTAAAGGTPLFGFTMLFAQQMLI